MVDQYNAMRQRDHEGWYLRMFLSNIFLFLSFHIPVLLWIFCAGAFLFFRCLVCFSLGILFQIFSVFYSADHCWLFSSHFNLLVFLNDRFLFILCFSSFIQYFVLKFLEMEYFVIPTESIIVHWYSINLMYPIFSSHFYQKFFNFLL